MTDQSEPLARDELVIVLIGASAVGKSTIARHLCDAGLVEATPTWATRTPRPGEQSTNYDHRFVTDEEFDRQDAGGGFIDQHAFYGARYGVTPLNKPEDNREALVVLKPVFMPAFIDYYPEARIYQIEASTEKLSARMHARGQSIEDITERMRLHAREAADARRYAHVVFSNNGAIEQAMEAVEAQIHADRAAHDSKLLSKA